MILDAVKVFILPLGMVSAVAKPVVFGLVDAHPVVSLSQLRYLHFPSILCLIAYLIKLYLIILLSMGYEITLVTKVLLIVLAVLSSILSTALA